MTTSVVILNWNGRDFLKKYLPCLLESVCGYDNVSVVVADNGSEDSSLELLETEFPQVQTIALDRNYGFAEGYNRALKELDSDLFLLLNSDIEVTPDWLEHLLEWMEFHPDCGICGPHLLDLKDKGKFEYAGAAGGYLDRYCYPFCRGRVMKMVEEDRQQYDCPQEVMWVSGAALMIRAELFRSLGGFCGQFFAHMEEIDLCWRARLEGWKVNTVPRSRVYHLGGGTLGNESPFKLYLNYRNNLLMMDRCLPKTLSIQAAYSLMGIAIIPDEGPDMIHNCNTMYENEYDVQMRDDIVTSSIQMGMLKSKALIFRRMLLDGLSAMAYLLQGSAAKFSAVVRAHRDFRKMKDKGADIKPYIESILSGERDDIARTILTFNPDCDNLGGKIFKLKGMWGRWIVLEAFLKKEAIFADIKDNIE